MAKYKLKSDASDRQKPQKASQRLNGGKLLLTAGLLMAPAVAGLDTESKSLQQTTTRSKEQLHAMEKIQIEVYDAIEKLHKSTWKDSDLGTEELLQTSSMSDQELNQQILSHLKEKNTEHTKASEGNAEKLKCVVGGKECLYKDKKDLINGDISSFVQLKFDQGVPVGLPVQNYIATTPLQAQLKVLNSAPVQSQAAVQTMESPNQVDDILNQKLLTDMEQAQLQGQGVDMTDIMAQAQQAAQQAHDVNNLAIQQNNMAVQPQVIGPAKPILQVPQQPQVQQVKAQPQQASVAAVNPTQQTQPVAQTPTAMATQQKTGNPLLVPVPASVLNLAMETAQLQIASNADPKAAQAFQQKQEQNEQILNEQARQIALANIQAKEQKKLIEETQRQAQIQLQLQARAKAEADAAAALLAKQKAEEEKKKAEELAAKKKAESIKQAKAALAQKLQEATDKKKREILAKEAFEKSKELAKEQAQSIAQQKAAEIATLMIDEQSMFEQQKIKAQKEKEAKQQAIEKREQEMKEAQQAKLNAEAQAAAEKQAAEEAEAREQARMKALKENQEREEAEEQERLRKEKEKKDMEEYNAHGDLGEMMDNLKTQVQKEAAMGKEYKKEEPAPKANVQVEDSDKDNEVKPDDSEQNIQLKASMETDANADTKSAVKIEVKSQNKVEKKAAQKVEASSTAKVESKAQATAQTSQKTETTAKVETKAAVKTESTQKSEQKVEQKVDSQSQQKSESQEKVEASSEAESEKHHKKKSDKKKHHAHKHHHHKKDNRDDEDDEEDKDQKVQTNTTGLSDETSKLLAEANEALKGDQDDKDSKSEQKPSQQAQQPKQSVLQAQIDKLKAEKKKKDEEAAATAAAQPVAQAPQREVNMATSTIVTGSDGEEHEFHEITFKPSVVPAAPKPQPQPEPVKQAQPQAQPQQTQVQQNQQQPPQSQPKEEAQATPPANAASLAHCPKPKPEPPIVGLMQNGKEFNFVQNSDDVLAKPEKIEFTVVPKSYRDIVNGIDVIESSKILGFNTYNNILINNHKKGDFMDSESEYYNVTLNLVVKRMTQFQADDIQKKRAEQKKKEAAMPLKNGCEGQENCTPVHIQLQYDLEDNQVDNDGEKAIEAVQTEQEAIPDTDSAVQLPYDADGQSKDPEQTLTQLSSEMSEDLELEKKHRKKRVSKEEQDESDIEEIQEQEENLNHIEHKKKNRHSQSKRENVDEVFRQIQDDDMKQEKFTDQTVQKVVTSQQQALIQQEREDQEAHNRFMRRLDAKGLSAVTHNAGTKITQLDTIELADQRMAEQKKRAAKLAAKQKFIEEELNSNDQDFEDHARVQTNAEDLNGFSDAEIEAQNLEKSLNEVNKHQEYSESLAEKERSMNVKSQSTMDLIKKVDAKAKAVEHQDTELLGEQSGQEINLDDMAISAQKLSQQTVAKIQAQLEARVQKDLDQLTIITNNEYAGGKHVYDYQLVRLTDGQQKEEREALEKADELYYKHSNLKKAESEINKKFENAEKTLAEYKQKFYKTKNNLQQDHDSFVKIKDQTEKELNEQIAIQQKTELMVTEAMMEKATLSKKDPTKVELTSQQMQMAQQQAKADAYKKSVIEQQEKTQNAHKEKLAAEAKLHKLQKEKIASEEKAKAEAKKAKELAEKKKAEEEQKHKEKMEKELRQKIENEYKKKMEEEAKIKEDALNKVKKEAEEKIKREHQARLDAIEKAKKKAAEKTKELKRAEAEAKKKAAEQEQIELKAKQEAEELEKKEEAAKKAAEEDLKKKKLAAEKAKLALAEKAKSIEAAKKKQEDEEFRAKVKEEVNRQALVQEQARKKAELQSIQEEKEKKQAQLLAEAQEKASQLELEKAESEAKAAEEAQKNAEMEAKLQEEELKKSEEEQKKIQEEKTKADQIAELELMDAKKQEELELKLKQGKEKTHDYNRQLELLQSESDMRMSSKLDAKLQQQAAAKAQAEKEAIKKIADATMAGIKAGEEASRKLHAEAKKQDEAQTVAAVEKLKTKFDNTKAQVLAIVSNFGKIHSDLQELKSEYLQEQMKQNGNYLQLESTIGANQTQISPSDSHLIEIKAQLNLKKKEVDSMVEQFQKMTSDFVQLKSSFDKQKKHDQVQLVQLATQEEETELSKLFEKQSEVLQSDIKNKQHKLKDSLKQNMKEYMQSK